MVAISKLSMPCIAVIPFSCLFFLAAIFNFKMPPLPSFSLYITTQKQCIRRRECTSVFALSGISFLQLYQLLLFPFGRHFGFQHGCHSWHILDSITVLQARQNNLTCSNMQTFDTKNSSYSTVLIVACFSWQLFLISKWQSLPSFPLHITTHDHFMRVKRM